MDVDYLKITGCCINEDKPDEYVCPFWESVMGYRCFHPNAPKPKERKDSRIGREMRDKDIAKSPKWCPLRRRPTLLTR